MNAKDAVIVIVENKEGLFHINKRARTKKAYPGKYGIGVGATREEGEEPASTAERELMEELQIRGTPKYLFSYHYSGPEVTHDVYVFHIKSEVAGTCDEFSWCGWVPPEKIDALISEGALANDNVYGWKQFRT